MVDNWGTLSVEVTSGGGAGLPFHDDKSLNKTVVFSFQLAWPRILSFLSSCHWSTVLTVLTFFQNLSKFGNALLPLNLQSNFETIKLGTEKWSRKVRGMVQGRIWVLFYFFFYVSTPIINPEAWPNTMEYCNYYYFLKPRPPVTVSGTGLKNKVFAFLF